MALSDSHPDDSPAAIHRIRCTLDTVLVARGVTLAELADRTGVTVANLSILKNNHAKAVRFTTLTAICDALDTTPAALFTID
jgi:putative transcriptional regulator